MSWDVGLDKIITHLSDGGSKKRGKDRGPTQRGTFPVSCCVMLYALRVTQQEGIASLEPWSRQDWEPGTVGLSVSNRKWTSMIASERKAPADRSQPFCNSYYEEPLKPVLP